MPADPDGGRAGAVPVPAPGSPAGTLNLTPKALLLIGEELRFIQELASFIPTPRAAKRMVHIYRLLKASLTEEDVATFVGNGEAPASTGR